MEIRTDFWRLAVPYWRVVGMTGTAVALVARHALIFETGDVA